MSGPLSGITLVGGGYGLLPVGLTGGGGSGIDDAEMVDGRLMIHTDPGVIHMYRRAIAVDNQRGSLVEISLQITSFKPRFRSGYFVILDDGINAYALSFVDTEIGRFVGVTLRSGSQMLENVGTEGLAAKLSTIIDWTQTHIYRLERRPQDGLYLFIDNDINPAIVLLDSEYIDYPISQFSSPTVAFGHLGQEGAISFTDFVRVAVSEGYEVSTKKIASEVEIERDIRKAQAVVLVVAQDDDP